MLTIFRLLYRCPFEFKQSEKNWGQVRVALLKRFEYECEITESKVISDFRFFRTIQLIGVIFNIKLKT